MLVAHRYSSLRDVTSQEPQLGGTGAGSMGPGLRSECPTPELDGQLALVAQVNGMSLLFFTWVLYWSPASEVMEQEPWDRKPWDVMS